MKPLKIYQLLIILIMILGLSCGSSGDDDDTDSNDNGTENTLQSTLSSIQENIFTPTCALSSCHGSSSPPQGLSLKSGESYTNLVNVTSGEASSLLRVSPNDSANSYLVHKIEGTAGTVGGTDTRMPLGGSSLTSDEIQAIKDWIDNGALDN